MGEGWGKQYIKLEALSSISDAITVIQQAFHAANRTPHHSPPDVPLSYKLAKKAIRLDKLTRYEQYLEVTQGQGHSNGFLLAFKAAVGQPPKNQAFGMQG